MFSQGPVLQTLTKMYPVGISWAGRPPLHRLWYDWLQAPDYKKSATQKIFLDRLATSSVFIALHPSLHPFRISYVQLEMFFLPNEIPSKN